MTISQANTAAARTPNLIRGRVALVERVNFYFHEDARLLWRRSVSNCSHRCAAIKKKGSKRAARTFARAEVQFFFVSRERETERDKKES